MGRVSSKPEAPVDDFSGIPLPIATHPLEETPAQAQGPEPINDLHHANFEKRRLVKSLGGMALRGSRVQYVPRGVHKQFHRFYREPDNGHDPDELAETVIFAAAGYVPDEGVGFDPKGKPHRVPLSRAERLGYIASNEIRVQCPDALKNFLFRHVVRRGLTPTERRTHNILLNQPDLENRKNIGRELALAASRLALKPMGKKFAAAWDEGLLPLAHTRDVGEFVCDMLVARPRGDVSRRAIRRLQSALVAA